MSISLKRFKILLIIIILLLIITSCNTRQAPVSINEPEEIESDNQDQNQESNIEETELENSIDEEVEGQEEEMEIIETEDMSISKLDGLLYMNDELNKRPIAVMFDNHPRARWQAGISEAEIVYECEVEYPYTRYLAIFLTSEPNQIGPIRSARPYFIDYALEYDPIYVHVGGSTEALAKIIDLYVANIDGLSSGAFWRYYYTGKDIPNNMYTTLEKIRRSAEYRGYRELGNYEGLEFNKKDKNISDTYDNYELAYYINIEYNKDNSTEYSYNSETKLYERSKDGQLHIDENNEKTITAKNIIIIELEKKVLDDEGRLYLKTIGDGKGFYLTNGEVIPITWENKEIRSKTTFYDENGNKISLNPGKTWIQVTSDYTNITFEEGINNE